MTSLLRRLTSAPVRVRVKNATGMRWTWSYTAVRRSRMSPSPMLAESQRVSSPVAASASAMTAITHGERHDGTDLRAVHDGVHDPAGEQRGGDSEKCQQAAEDQEGDERPAVTAGEAHDASEDGP